TRGGRGARSGGLELEAVLFFRVGHGWGGGLIRRARGIFGAEKLHVAAERNGRNLPARTIAVVKAGDLGTEANREHQHFNAAPARHQKMAKLVEENDDGQNEQKQHYITNEA